MVSGELEQGEFVLLQFSLSSHRRFWNYVLASATGADTIAVLSSWLSVMRSVHGIETGLRSTPDERWSRRKHENS